MLSNEHKQLLSFICYRVADMPTPRVPSVRYPCAGCSAPIWVANKWPSAPPKFVFAALVISKVRQDPSGKTRVTDVSKFIMAQRIAPHVRYWHLADIPNCTAHVRFWV